MRAPARLESGAYELPRMGPPLHLLPTLAGQDFGWDPRNEETPTRIWPQTVRAWRSVSELRGRVVMRDGAWLGEQSHAVGMAARPARPDAGHADLLQHWFGLWQVPELSSSDHDAYGFRPCSTTRSSMPGAT
ncbi:hypothetical protein GCM10010347_63800 [Streptomyces cirratus]|uniref:Uncharacterized protein n=1 Tax=Streptomyces cirratus TaxID=68187 RepID=A0ABQ3F2L3_9ACTN|nr:hypothetical protein GCM10010347_63800 [Streptomyces cirratus]